ncbi:MAG: sigma-70 family RNA polymerase sigma factor [Acidobacteriota bacterium]|nr:sigma-70 family RNA polymerase sigma factor [Acidobacteriota bacterium]
MAETGEITELLADVRKGDQRAIETLVPIVYQELRRLASYYMQRERPEHTLQATALVHEAYLRLAGGEKQDWQDRAHFFAAAAQVMRNLLIDHARARRRDKRGGGCDICLDDAITLAVVENPDLLAIDEALEGLVKIDPRQSRIVELRYYGGLSIKEVAAVLDISDRTVKREWQMAKAWLYAEIRGQCDA